MKKTLVIITGQSGAGKSKALGALEDLGYFTVENLPTELISRFVGLGEDAPEKMSHMAITLRITNPTNVELLKDELKRLKTDNVETEILYLATNTDTLIRRYQETRRNHPLINESGSIFDAIQKEQLILKAVRDLATQIIDTSYLKSHDLRIQIKKRYSIRDAKGSLRVTLMSFGFKFGVPTEADLVMDVRFINNPHYDDSLREFDGLNQKIIDFVMSDDSAIQFIDKFQKLLKFLLPQYLAREGKNHITVAFGCTGGKHRSVVITEQLATILTELGYDIMTVHRDRGRK
ncbi:MAG: RNase adapter RapZ [Caldisericia bacterium]|nr:RNase adapter RapZ [Caldisericia bacterium]